MCSLRGLKGLRGWCWKVVDGKGKGEGRERERRSERGWCDFIKIFYTFSRGV